MAQLVCTLTDWCAYRGVTVEPGVALRHDGHVRWEHHALAAVWHNALLHLQHQCLGGALNQIVICHSRTCALTRVSNFTEVLATLRTR